MKKVNKFKKVFSLIMSLIFVILCFSGCGVLDEIDDVVLDLDGTIFSDMNDDNTNEETKLTVAFIFDGEINDGGYTQMHNNGRNQVEKMPGVKTIYKEDVSDNVKEVEKVCEDFVKQGANVIYGTSFGYMEGMDNMAKKYPDVIFVHCSGYMTEQNMSNFFGKIYQMRYLTGIVAGKMTKTNKIGYVAAFPIPEVIRGINAFTLGVQKVNPDAVVEVEWTSTWNDYNLEKKTAQSLINKGVDVIAQHQNTTGAQSAAAEANIYSIGYNRDMSYENDKQLTAPIWNWGVYYTDCTQRILDGKWKSGSEWLDASTGLVDIAPISNLVDEDTKKIVNDEKQKLINGDDEIFAGPVYNQEGKEVVKKGDKLSDSEVSSMDWFVKGVIGEAK